MHDDDNDYSEVLVVTLSEQIPSNKDHVLFLYTNFLNISKH